jgi:CrcB protein
MPNLQTIFIVGAGGFLGANMRHYLSTYLTTRFLLWTGIALPVGTLFVNVVGSFLLAVFSVLLARIFISTPQMRLLIGTGFFGAFTTFSTFANETINLANKESLTLALGYWVLTNLLCLVGVVLGIAFAQRWA